MRRAAIRAVATAGTVLLVLVLGSPPTESQAQSGGLCGVDLSHPESAAPAFAPPPGGSAQVDKRASGDRCTLRWANGARYAEAETDKIGRPETILFFDETGRLKQEIGLEYSSDESGGGGEDQEESEDAPNKCASSTWSALSIDWGITNLHWRINTASLPNYLKDQPGEIDDTIQAIRNGRIAWENNTNPCVPAIADTSAINFTYDGITNQTFHQDTISVVDYGESYNVCGSPGSLGCHAKYYAVGTGDMIECDIRIDHDWNWSKQIQTLPSGHHDIWGFIAHETGHCGLFVHVADANQIMRSGLPPRSKFKRKLSKGDAIGNNAKH